MSFLVYFLCVFVRVILNILFLSSLFYPKGNQSWIFIGTTDAEDEAPILWPPDEKSRLIGKDPDAGKHGKPKKRSAEDEIDSITDSMDMIWASSGSQWQTGKPGVLQSTGHKESDTTLSDRTTVTNRFLEAELLR